MFNESTLHTDLRSDFEFQELLDYVQRVHDLYLPRRLLTFAADRPRQEAYLAAIEKVLIRQTDSCVLATGIGASLWAMAAAGAGARQVTICEPWPFLAAIAQSIAAANGLWDRIQVRCCKLTELTPEVLGGRLQLWVTDHLDDGLLGNGLALEVAHVQANLLADGAVTIPRCAHIRAMPVAQKTGFVSGFDLAPFDRYRSCTAPETIQWGSEPYQVMGPAFDCFRVGFQDPIHPLCKTVRVPLTATGAVNAVVYWFDLTLDEAIGLSNAPPTPSQSGWLQMRLYLERQIPVNNGGFLVLEVRHDGQRVHFSKVPDTKGFDTESAIRPTVPPWHFRMLFDRHRNNAYQEAINRAIGHVPSPLVLDIGAGTGLLSMMAAQAGATTVTACEMVPHIAEMARDTLQLNGFDTQVRLIAKSSHEMTVPEEMARKATILVSETVDHGLLGEGFLVSLEHARRHLVTDDAVIIPAGATIYAVGIEMHTHYLAEFDFKLINQLRLNHYDCVDLNSVPHRRLTDIFSPFRFDFYQRSFQPMETAFEIPVVADGFCNGIAFWYDLHLDETITLNTGPESNITAWQQAVMFFDREVPVTRGDCLFLIGYHTLQGMGFMLDEQALFHHYPQHLAESASKWYERMLAQEQSFQQRTAKMSALLHEMALPRAATLLEALQQHSAQLGLDSRIVADFIEQLGYV